MHYNNMAINSRLQKTTIRLENSIGESNGLNGFPIKREPGFRYKVVSEKVHYSDGDYVRTCVKKIDKLSGQIISETYYHQPISLNN